MSRRPLVATCLAIVVLLAVGGLAWRFGRGRTGAAGAVRAGAPAPANDSMGPASSANAPPADEKPMRRRGFRDVAATAGIGFRMNFLPGEQGEVFKVNLYDHGCGVAVGDIDRDGQDDIYFCNQLGPNALYRNRGDGTFEDVTAAAGGVALDDRICVAAAFADYDNDGDQDLFVTSVRGGNALFQNDGQGRYSDVTEAAGLALVAHSQTGTFFDVENDGDLDLLVTNSASWTTDEFNQAQRYYVGPLDFNTTAASPKEFNVLYRNNGNGTFTNVTESSGLKGRGWANDAAILDYDGDGLMDVLITNMFGRSQLYHNEGMGVFRDATVETLQRTPFGSVGAKAFDFNNDGLLDLFLTDMHSDMWMEPSLHPSLIDERRKYALGDRTRPAISEQSIEKELAFADSLGEDLPRVFFGNGMYKNLGDGRFQETSDAAGVETFWPWGIADADYDNDGDLDVFMPSGMGYPFFHWRNYLLINNGNGDFIDQSSTRGIDPPPGGRDLPQPIGGRAAARSSRAAATADFDADGRVDLIVNNFNDAPFLFRNEFPKRNFIQFRLEGTRSNRDAIQAVVRVVHAAKTQVRQVAPTGGYLSHSSRTLHFGLGDDERIDRVEIRWPSGAIQVLQSPAINRRHDVVEPETAVPDAPVSVRP
jgi:enediyne biosynthesis protein E4